MTAEDKIKEAKYNFDKLKNGNNNEDVFQFELSNFLSSCSSILSHLLEDHNKKFGLNIDYVTIKTFRDKASRTKNKDALNFIKWYSEINPKIRSDNRCGFLLARRNHSVHKDATKAENALHLDGIKIEYDNGKTQEIEAKHSWRFFNENKNENALSVCAHFLNTLIMICNDAKRQFNHYLP
jgi:hypothetical protein